ncbi:MAG TPA: branched-chain amino acid ABC transporter permease [Caldilineaceae bacterium]|nr:branched-chain amino acid ABC transporter permease [Caldilineaceae bacterium]
MPASVLPGNNAYGQTTTTTIDANLLTTALLIDSLVRSIQVGSLYALMAVGLTLTLAVIKLPNFAHAELITVGAYTALVVSLYVAGNPLLVMVSAFLAAASTAWLAHRIVYRPLARRRSSTYTLILASFATGLIVRYLLFLLADHYNLFDKRIAVAQTIWVQTTWLTLTNIFFWVVPTSIALVLALSLLLRFTPLGRQMRALADNFTLAKVIGIPVDRVHDLTWLLAGGLAGVAGALWGIQTFVDPLVGWLAILSVFAAVVLGGMTSFIGTILGAFVVGFAENTLMQLLNAWVGLDFSFKPIIPFVIIIIVLLIRPEGLRMVND